MITTYVLGPFRLDTRGGVLLRGGEPVALGQRAVALLRALVERPGALVSKDALIEAAWPGLAVEDSNLAVQIAALRRALGNTPGGDRWIETMPRRGYRFIGPVVANEEKSTIPPPPQVGGPQETASMEIGTIAAAPQFDNSQKPSSTELPEAERRQITAVSCELLDVTAEAGMDLDDVREAVGDFQRCVSETVGRHGGLIARHLGNSVLVLFGYPEAHEDDAERAVRTGLQLCLAVKSQKPEADLPTRCRVGIATGMVIVDAGGVAQLHRHAITGNVPILAAQIAMSASPDTVALDSTTRRLIGNLFDCRDLGAITTTGGKDPVRSWQVLGESVVASRFEALRGAVHSPLIGRDEEIDLLLRRWARAKSGDGQIVLVSGEPGIGKSRLVVALHERLDAVPHLRLRYICSPFHQDSALFPFIEQLGQAASFSRDDMPADKLNKLEALLARALPPDEDVALLADLLTLPAPERCPLPNLSAQRKKDRTLEALIRQLEGLARQQPMVVVFEDVHWMDPTSRELVDLTIERVRSLPVLLILTFRPEFQPPWAGQAKISMVVLNRLDRRDRAAMVAQIAHGKALPDRVIAQIADRTDGVPLFVEELTKSVLESGLLREEHDRYVLEGALLVFAIPTTLHASLLARLDRLASVRHVAQIGAAIGRQFSYTLLYAVSRLPEDELRSALARLVASELVFQRGAPPDATYSFKHALVQDAAYGSLLRKAQERLHARIAEELETHSPDLIDTQPELFAQHYAAAGLVEKSAAFWGKAGQRSIAGSAMVEAAAQFQKALAQLKLLPETLERKRQELELLSSLGASLIAVKGQAAPETGNVYARARELWEQLGSPSDFLQIPFGQSRYYMYHGEFDLAQRLAEDLVRLSESRNDRAGRVLGRCSSGRNLSLIGRFRASRSHLGEAIALYDPIARPALVRDAGVDPQVLSRAFLGIVLLCLGYVDQAFVQSSAAIADARKLAHPPSLASALAIGAGLLSLGGDDALLRERADELVAITSEHGFTAWHAQGTVYRGYAQVNSGDVENGASILRAGLNSYRATGTKTWTPHLIALFASACQLQGQFEEGLILLQDAVQTVEATREHWLDAELNRQKGQLLSQQGHTDIAEKLYREAMSIAREQEAKLWELRAAKSLALLWRDQGRHAEACDLLVPVYGWFTEGFDTPDLIDAKLLLDGLDDVRSE